MEEREEVRLSLEKCIDAEKDIWLTANSKFSSEDLGKNNKKAIIGHISTLDATNKLIKDIEYKKEKDKYLKLILYIIMYCKVEIYCQHVIDKHCDKEKTEWVHKKSGLARITKLQMIPGNRTTHKTILNGYVHIENGRCIIELKYEKETGKIQNGDITLKTGQIINNKAEDKEKLNNTEESINSASMNDKTEESINSASMNDKTEELLNSLDISEKIEGTIVELREEVNKLVRHLGLEDKTSWCINGLFEKLFNSVEDSVGVINYENNNIEEFDKEVRQLIKDELQPKYESAEELVLGMSVTAYQLTEIYDIYIVLAYEIENDEYGVIVYIGNSKQEADSIKNQNKISTIIYNEIKK